MTLRALIFDFDGTIVDTESPAHSSTAGIWERHGVELDLDWWIGGLGTDRKLSWVEALEEAVGRPLDHAALLAERQRVKDLATDRQPVLPGVHDLVEAARSRGMQLAVGSSSEHRWVDRHLERVRLLDRFDHVVCRDDVGGQAKPAPHVFLRAVELLGVEPHETVVIEDSHNGVAAARAAGIHALVVPNPLLAHLDFPDARWRCGSLDEHLPHDLLDLLHG